MMTTMERGGMPQGRWPNYLLSVNGVLLGRVWKAIPRVGQRSIGWRVSTTASAPIQVLRTREEAERCLILQARSAGRIS